MMDLWTQRRGHGKIGEFCPSPFLHPAQGHWDMNKTDEKFLDNSPTTPTEHLIAVKMHQNLKI